MEFKNIEFHILKITIQD